MGPAVLSSALLRCCMVGRVKRCGARLDGKDKFGEGCQEPMPWIYIQAEYVVAAAEILDERVASSDHSCRTESFEAAHRPEPSLQAAMVGFYKAVGVLLGDMEDYAKRCLKK